MCWSRRGVATKRARSEGASSPFAQAHRPRQNLGKVSGPWDSAWHHNSIIQEKLQGLQNRTTCHKPQWADKAEEQLSLRKHSQIPQAAGRDTFNYIYRNPLYPSTPPSLELTTKWEGHWSPSVKWKSQESLKVMSVHFIMHVTIRFDPAVKSFDRLWKDFQVS